MLSNLLSFHVFSSFIYLKSIYIHGLRNVVPSLYNIYHSTWYLQIYKYTQRLRLDDHIAVASCALYFQNKVCPVWLNKIISLTRCQTTGQTIDDLGVKSWKSRSLLNQDSGLQARLDGELLGASKLPYNASIFLVFLKIHPPVFANFRRNWGASLSSWIMEQLEICMEFCGVYFNEANICLEGSSPPPWISDYLVFSWLYPHSSHGIFMNDEW